MLLTGQFADSATRYPLYDRRQAGFACRWLGPSRYAEFLSRVWHRQQAQFHHKNHRLILRLFLHHFVCSRKNAIVAGQASFAAFRFASSCPSWARRNPCPAPSYTCGSYVLPSFFIVAVVRATFL